MIKIDIKNRTNLTLLAKGYLENLFPKGRSREVFYDYDKKNEIKSIYFANVEYYDILIKSFNEKMTGFLSSNAADEWINLYKALKNHEIIENVDYGELELYDITEKGETTPEINTDFTRNKVNKEDFFLKNMKRIYPGYNISYAGNRNFVIIRLNLDSVEKFEFDLKPIIELLDVIDKKLKNFSFYNDPSRNYTSIRIEI